MNVAMNDQILAFAGAVRAQLNDLPAEDVDDIIGGLVADLSEQAADTGGELSLGDPEAYAAELRSAAGLPERSATPLHVPLSTRLRSWGDEQIDALRKNRRAAAVIAFLLALRPVWWVLRGMAWYFVLQLALPYNYWSSVNFVPRDPFRWLLLIACVILSVQWGRDRWLPKTWLRSARTALSVLAILALPYALPALLQPRYEQFDTEPYVEPGLVLDGARVSNLYAYDAQGNLLDGVQLYTDSGTPLDIRGAGSDDIPWFELDSDYSKALVPWQDTFRRTLWNVYPLRVTDIDENTGNPDLNDAAVSDAPYPHAPVEVATPEETTTTPTPAPETTAAPNEAPVAPDAPAAPDETVDPAPTP